MIYLLNQLFKETEPLENLVYTKIKAPTLVLGSEATSVVIAIISDLLKIVTEDIV